RRRLRGDRPRARRDAAPRRSCGPAQPRFAPTRRRSLMTFRIRRTAARRALVPVVAFVLFHLIGGIAMAQSNTEIEARNKSLVQAAFDAWKAGTGNPFALLADDASWTIVGNSDAANTYPSREAFLEQVIRPFNARMKEGIKPTVRGLFADGDAVIIFFDA